MRKVRKALSDTTTTKEYKKQRVQAWKAEANAIQRMKRKNFKLQNVKRHRRMN